MAARLAKLKQENEERIAALRASKLLVRPGVAAWRERPLGGPIGTRHIYRPGTVELRSIRRFQKSAEQLIPEGAFRRLLCESQAFAPLDISEDEKEVARLLLLSNNAAQRRGGGWARGLPTWGFNVMQHILSFLPVTPVVRPHFRVPVEKLLLLMGLAARRQGTMHLPSRQIPRAIVAKIISFLPPDRTSPTYLPHRHLPRVALLMLRDAGEAFLTKLLADSVLCACHRGSPMVWPEDIQLAMYCSGRSVRFGDCMGALRRRDGVVVVRHNPIGARRMVERLVGAEPGSGAATNDDDDDDDDDEDPATSLHLCHCQRHRFVEKYGVFAERGAAPAVVVPLPAVDGVRYDAVPLCLQPPNLKPAPYLHLYCRPVITLTPELESALTRVGHRAGCKYLADGATTALVSALAGFCRATAAVAYGTPARSMLLARQKHLQSVTDSFEVLQTRPRGQGLFYGVEAKGAWTEEEDKALNAMVLACEEGKLVEWSLIAEKLPGRNDKQCRERWVGADGELCTDESASSSSSSGGWSTEEEEDEKSGWGSDGEGQEESQRDQEGTTKHEYNIPPTTELLAEAWRRTASRWCGVETPLKEAAAVGEEAVAAEEAAVVHSFTAPLHSTAKSNVALLGSLFDFKPGGSGGGISVANEAFVTQMATRTIRELDAEFPEAEEIEDQTAKESLKRHFVSFYVRSIGRVAACQVSIESPEQAAEVVMNHRLGSVLFPLRQELEAFVAQKAAEDWDIAFCVPEKQQHPALALLRRRLLGGREHAPLRFCAAIEGALDSLGMATYGSRYEEALGTFEKKRRGSSGDDNNFTPELYLREGCPYGSNGFAKFIERNEEQVEQGDERENLRDDLHGIDLEADVFFSQLDGNQCIRRGFDAAAYAERINSVVSLCPGCCRQKHEYVQIHDAGGWGMYHQPVRKFSYLGLPLAGSYEDDDEFQTFEDCFGPVDEFFLGSNSNPERLRRTGLGNRNWNAISDAGVRYELHLQRAVFRIAARSGPFRFCSEVMEECCEVLCAFAERFMTIDINAIVDHHAGIEPKRYSEAYRYSRYDHILSPPDIRISFLNVLEALLWTLRNADSNSGGDSSIFPLSEGGTEYRGTTMATLAAEESTRVSTPAVVATAATATAATATAATATAAAAATAEVGDLKAEGGATTLPPTICSMKSNDGKWHRFEAVAEGSDPADTLLVRCCDSSSHAPPSSSLSNPERTEIRAWNANGEEESLRFELAVQTRRCGLGFDLELILAGGEGLASNGDDLGSSGITAGAGAGGGGGGAGGGLDLTVAADHGDQSLLAEASMSQRMSEAISYNPLTLFIRPAASDQVELELMERADEVVARLAEANSTHRLRAVSEVVTCLRNFRSPVAGATEEGAEASHREEDNSVAGATEEGAEASHREEDNSVAGATEEGAEASHREEDNSVAGATEEGAEASHREEDNCIDDGDCGGGSGSGAAEEKTSSLSSASSSSSSSSSSPPSNAAAEQDRDLAVVVHSLRGLRGVPLFSGISTRFGAFGEAHADADLVQFVSYLGSEDRLHGSLTPAAAELVAWVLERHLETTLRIAAQLASHRVSVQARRAPPPREYVVGCSTSTAEHTAPAFVLPILLPKDIQMARRLKGWRA